MQALRMAAAYALISILSASGGVVVLWPSWGWWSLASVWPVGGISCLAAAALVAVLRRHEGRDIDHLTDEMVADLRGVLANSRQMSGDDEPAATRDLQQRYGTAG